MRGNSKTELEQTESARDGLRMGDPYVLDLSHNDKVFDPLAKSVVRSKARSAIQAIGDWIRNKDFYYIDGKSVDTIQIEMKAKKLEAAVKQFLATDDADAIVCWQMYCHELFPLDTNTKIDFELAKKIIETTEEQVAENKGNSECLNASDDEPAAMKALKDTIVKPITILFTDKNAKTSEEFLREMWRTYLLPSLDTTQQDQFIQVLFDYGHQGGVFHTLSTAIAEKVLLAHIDASGAQDRNAMIDSERMITDETLTHKITAENLMQHCSVNVSFAEGKVFVHETSPISVLLKRTDAPTPASVRDIIHPQEFLLANGYKQTRNMFLMEPEAIHSIAFDADKQEKVTQILLRENIYSDAVLPTLSHVYTEDIRKDVQKYFDLVNYANAYIDEASHDANLADEILKKYPDVANSETIKTSYVSFHSGTSAKGDKILNYLGEHYPSYFTNLMTRQHEHFNNENNFTFFFKLLVRLGNFDAEQGHNIAAKELLQKYMDTVGVRIKIPEGILNEPMIRKIYQALDKMKFFADYQLPAPRNIFKEEKNIFHDQGVIAKMNGVLDKFVNYARMSHSSSSSPTLVSQFTGEAMFFTQPQIQEKRAARAFFKYTQLDPEASMSAFRAKVFLYCILANSKKFPDLSQAMRKEFRHLTLDGLRTELNNELKFRGGQFDFATLNKDVILQLAGKATRLTEQQMDDPFGDVINKLQKFNGPQTWHKPNYVPPS